MPPRTEPRTFGSGSVSAWYGKLRHRQVRPNPTDKVLWEQVLYKPRPKKKKAAHTPATPQPMHNKTSLLLARPLTQHTVLRILQTTDSPDYQLSVHTSQRHRLIGHLLAPIFGAQAFRDAEAFLIAQGNQSLCARHISICFAARFIVKMQRATRVYTTSVRAMASGYTRAMQYLFRKRTRQDAVGKDSESDYSVPPKKQCGHATPPRTSQKWPRSSTLPRARRKRRPPKSPWILAKLSGNGGDIFDLRIPMLDFS